MKWQSADDEYEIGQVLLTEFSVWTSGALGAASKVLEELCK